MVVCGRLLRFSHIVLISLVFGILLSNVDVHGAGRMDAILNMDDNKRYGTVGGDI